MGFLMSRLSLRARIADSVSKVDAITERSALLFCIAPGVGQDGACPRMNSFRSSLPKMSAESFAAGSASGAARLTARRNSPAPRASTEWPTWASKVLA